MTVDAAEHLAYYEDQARRSNTEFWERFGRRPDFAGADVLDIGCGHGALSVEMAREGASVCGIDPASELVEWAKQNVAERHPDLADRLSFSTQDAGELQPDSRFDLAVSKDTFEHVADIPGLLRDLRRLLRPGGELWVGFSPLYYSPRGDHDRTGLRIPWAHAVLPESRVLARAQRLSGEPLTSLEDLGMNGLTPAQFRAAVPAAGLELDSIAYNRGDKARLRALGVMRRLGPLEKFATVSIYAIVRRPA